MPRSVALMRPVPMPTASGSTSTRPFAAMPALGASTDSSFSTIAVPSEKTLAKNGSSIGSGPIMGGGAPKSSGTGIAPPCSSGGSLS